MSGTLYLVATPIGNLSDITYRAIETLKLADVIACEDTRHSLKLLNHYGIKKPLISYHKFNEQKASETIISKLTEGQNVALISDAGTPCISDPGQDIVRLCIERGIAYTMIPGAAAFVSGLVLSGFDNGSFLFSGFLPQKNTEREKYLESLKNVVSTLIFYSAPHDIKKDIDSLYKSLGNRKYAAVKEITKLHESVHFATLEEGFLPQPKGEYVIVVEGGAELQNPLAALQIDSHIDHYLQLGYSTMDAVKKVSKDRNLPKSEVYKYTIK